jgi:hypothetical protein
VTKDVFLDLLVRDLGGLSQRLQKEGEKSRRRLRLNRAYSVGICVSHVEKVFCIRRVCLGLKDALGTFCTADTHGESHTANEDVHIVI